MNNELRFTLQPVDQCRLAYLKNKVFKKITNLNSNYFYSKEPVPFVDRKNYKLSAARRGTVWNDGVFGCAWFNFTADIPEKFASDERLVVMIDIGGEGCLYDDNGHPVRGITGISSFQTITHLVRGKQEIQGKDFVIKDGKIDIWVDAASNHKPTDAFKKAFFNFARVCIRREDVAEFYYDYCFLAMLKNVIEDKKRRRSIAKALNLAFSAGFSLSNNGIKKAREILNKEIENGEKLPIEAYTVGHAHLDLAWLWPIRETKRKAIRTFTNQLRNTEKFPGYVFGASQAQQFEWMEKENPQLFAEIKQAVADGRFEVQGGMWVECDTNVTSGESLVRQNLYGKRYWKEKFGRDMKYCWLPDTFGYNGNLPQILKKCGIDYFMTTKLSWNEHNKFPKRSFIWEGIDDSDVIVHMPPEDTYNGAGDPLRTIGAYKKYPEKEKVKVFGILYGAGDGGGGPSEGHIEFMRRQEKAAGLPTVKMAPATKLFERLETFRDNMDTVKGELYLEKHQGTYTSQALSKRYNRKVEYKLHNVEFLSAAAAKLGYTYPKEALDRIWKEILLYQFHDIIPGSSIARVYEESHARYEEIFKELNALSEKALSYFVKDGAPTAINPTPYTQKTLVVKDGVTYMAAVRPYAAALLQEFKPADVITATENSLDSALFSVKFDGKGNIISLLDRQSGRELCGDFLNKFNLYHDIPREYDAWDIEWEYYNKTPDTFEFVSATCKEENGRAYVENKYKFNLSTLTQRVILAEDKPYVDFETEIDWQETHKMLRAEFRPTVFADDVTCDIQFGNLKRTTHDRNSVEHAQFEICAHKYIDLSSNGYGISMLSDAKYGWRVKEGTISLNVLRSPMFPAPDADKGKQVLRYALYPHSGDFCEAETAKYAYLYNNPLIVCDKCAVLPSVVQSDNRDVIVETVKGAESGEGTVIRVYENAGQAEVSTLKIGIDFSAAYETNMLEEVIAPIDLTKPVEFKPFEIKTILVK